MHLLCVCVRNKNQSWVYPPRLLWSSVMRLIMLSPPISTIMHWLTGQCSWMTTLGHIEPELCNIFYSKRMFRQFHGLRCRQTPSVGRNKKRLSSDQWTRLHVRIVHPKWSCDQSNRAWRWRNVNCGSSSQSDAERGLAHIQTGAATAVQYSCYTSW
jgi:hypothetical protein